MRVKNKMFSFIGKHFKFSAISLQILFWASLYIFAMKMFFHTNNTTTSEPSSEMKKTTRNFDSGLNKEDVLELQMIEASSEESEETEQEIRSIIEGRSKIMQTLCKTKTQLNKAKVERKALFIDKKHKLLWCSVFKAASTSWLLKLIALSGNKRVSFKNRNPIVVARELFPEPSRQEFREALHTSGITSLIIVRDPFVRILSAYRDKLERKALPYYKDVSRLIIKRYRKIEDNPKARSKRPTFEEFVKFLIDPETDVARLDEHWIPYSKYCSPCTVNYTTIAKVETLERDNKYIVKKLGVEELLSKQQYNLRNKFINKSKDGKNTSALIRKYFGKLNTETLKKLIQVYEDDFDLFGYDKRPYYTYVKNK